MDNDWGKKRKKKPKRIFPTRSCQRFAFQKLTDSIKLKKGFKPKTYLVASIALTNKCKQKRERETLREEKRRVRGEEKPRGIGTL